MFNVVWAYEQSGAARQDSAPVVRGELPSLSSIKESRQDKVLRLCSRRTRESAWYAVRSSAVIGEVVIEEAVKWVRPGCFVIHGEYPGDWCASENLDYPE